MDLSALELAAFGLLSKFNISIPGQNLQFILIGGGVFLFLLLFALARHHMLAWTFKGAWFGVFFGMVITLIVESFLLVGGRTALAEVVKNEKTPKNVRVFLQENIAALAQDLTGAPKTLGAKEEVDSKTVISNFGILTMDEQDKVKESICTP